MHSIFLIFVRFPVSLYIFYIVECYFVRYFLRVTVVKWLNDIVKEMPLAVRTVSPYSNTSCSIKMEVGIEDALHIEFEYNKSRFPITFILIHIFKKFCYCRCCAGIQICISYSLYVLLCQFIHWSEFCLLAII